MNCNQCEYLYINGVGCHETGCPATGQPVVVAKRLPYVGIRRDNRSRVMFMTRLEPSPYYFPEYSAVIGPFKTQRAAKWAALNPWNWSHVSDAEILAAKGGN